MILHRTMGIAQIPIEAFGSVSVSDFVCFRLLQKSGCAAARHERPPWMCGGNLRLQVEELKIHSLAGIHQAPAAYQRCIESDELKVTAV